MYTRCLFCQRDLGRNEAIEAFPVGGRLAYDPAKGRLWVVCPGCTRWNLTPLEERWEAIEQAERLFRGARVRASSDNIGLARVKGRAELVRIGRPTLPEFVSWRYAEAFERRRRQAHVRHGVALALTTAVALMMANALTGGVGAFVAAKWLWDGFNDSSDPERERERAAAADGDLVARVVITRRPVSITRGAIRRAVLHHDGDALALTFPFGRDTRTLVGERAQRATATMLTHLNAAGAPREFVNRALDRLVAAGSAEAFLAEVGRRGAGLRALPNGTQPGLSLGIASAQTRMALEIALNEAAERQALEGALAALEQAWRDAEQIAAIADALALPRGVEGAFARLRGRAERRG